MTINSFIHETISKGIPIVMGKDTYDLQDIQDSQPKDTNDPFRLTSWRGVRKIQRR